MMLDNELKARKCALPSCKQEFQPITTWQRFDTVECRNKYAALERKRGVQLLRAQEGRL